MTERNAAQLAFRFVLLIGVINLFADWTYEGARSIAGPFLGSLGAGAAVVGFSAGFGELAGYGLRSISGYVADRTRLYWPLVFIGYAINLLAAPALALAGNWPAAAALVIAERTGRAIRKPAMEAMLSHASPLIGSGWVFGLNGALDQAGATIGPLTMASILYRHGGYHNAFASLLIPALLCLLTLAFARLAYPRPQDLDSGHAALPSAAGASRTYWLCVAGGAMIAAGFADFSLIGFHLRKAEVLAAGAIPVLYAVAMAVAGLAGLVFGRLLDKFGPRTLGPGLFVPAFAAPLVFLGGPVAAVAGVVLWGIGMGVQDTAFKAVLAGVVPKDRRGTAFGVYDTVYGMAWFAGSAAMGVLHDVSLTALVAFSVLTQLVALPILYVAAGVPAQAAQKK